MIALAGSQAAARIARGCDRCGAPITDTAVLRSGKRLQFCGHHKNEHEDALNHAGAVWQFGYQEVSQ